MFGGLSGDFDVQYVNTIGHDPRYPVTDNWPHLVDELIGRVAQRGAPVLGVGHSLGGYLTLLAAVKRPDLFRAIVLLDSTILAPWKAAALRLIKRLGLADYVTPAGVTRDRRSAWPSVEEAAEHFRDKPAFRDFDADCLRDYVTLGTHACAAGVCLVFDPSIEYRIYRTFPDTVASELPALRVPAGFICGSDSEDVRRFGLATTRRHFRVACIQGGHLFPFEHPEAAARAIREMAGALGAS